MTALCPHCQGTGYRLGRVTTDAEIEAIAEGLRAACRVAGKRITGDDRVDEATAAMLVGREKGTLRNWRNLHQPIPFLKRAGRPTYEIPDIARWMVEAGEAEG